MSLANPQTDAEDATLLRAVARGDEAAFARVYDRYSAILLGLMLRILRSRPEAEDVLQEVFLQVWQQARSFDPARGRAFTWLVTLARSDHLPWMSCAAKPLDFVGTRKPCTRPSSLAHTSATSAIEPLVILCFFQLLV